MSSFFTISLSFLLLFFFINLRSTESAAPTYLYNYCSNATRFAPNSTYQSNLNKLLSSLSSAAAAANNTNGFANATAGQNPPDRAYGLFLCRADVSASTCSDCVAAGTQDILQRCPNQRVSVIWYDECMLRYSNQSIYSVMDTVPSLMMYNTGNISDPTRFAQILGDTMDDIVARASGDESGKKAATAEANFTSLQKLYTLAQCTPDLTASDCNTCLQSVKSNLPSGKQGGRDFSPSCSVRFELYPFYNASAVAAPPPPPSQIPPPPPAPVTRPKGKSNKTTVIIIAVAVPVGVAVVLLFLACCFRRRKAAKTYEVAQGDESGGSEITTAESLQFHLATIQAATNNFSHQNKLGQGGFGEVFRGQLLNGQEIAVKRLSEGSGQGVGEFKNEVVLLAKLQHRNLVRLLGFCLEGEEKILVYEFVPNKSLDYFLFDPDKRRQLDWSRRYKIISGIARGMLYLHEDSRLRIIHRDLKPSNILLDSEMNPKISDFGMARIFGVDQTRAKTNKIVGTFGYLSPEYAMRGQISVKSDVYSFGVLILEIITGKKNSCSFQSDGGENLTGYAWKHWRAGTPLEVLDPSIGDSCSMDEVIRCLHIGLLGVQEDPADRPTMASIVLMLSSHSVKLPQPRRPAFFLQKSMERQLKELKSGESTGGSMPWSINEMSVTEVSPR
ncbi:cysteine-rich receptor-like protein kinase 10 isoform X1 [Rhodamnia argentea]|uniref:Cysteine-rich receptor-like protein kinase 10 isoform X1 n=1 Tax=Rhodamnia argentea TaxID=178133 RepID=A0ABM3H8I9_9MYRT|nr:cysteine-rich receptor-like protein kinase 10 isoform X1 [Rhodamnia argentea]